MTAIPMNPIAAPTTWARRGRSLRMSQARRMVKKTCAMMTSDESPTGKPSWMAMNNKPNCPTPMRSP